LKKDAHTSHQQRQTGTTTPINPSILAPNAAYVKTLPTSAASSPKLRWSTGFPSWFGVDHTRKLLVANGPTKSIHLIIKGTDKMCLTMVTQPVTAISSDIKHHDRYKEIKPARRMSNWVCIA
jgi:hypothetical protein